MLSGLRGPRFRDATLRGDHLPTLATCRNTKDDQRANGCSFAIPNRSAWANIRLQGVSPCKRPPDPDGRLRDLNDDGDRLLARLPNRGQPMLLGPIVPVR
jgi:hypothetical protein